MKINEITAPVEQDELEPSPEEIQQVRDLIGTIDVVKEQPQTLLSKLTQWMKEYPLIDKITDLIPQTRIVKALSAAVDAVEKGDNVTALNSLASVLTGTVGKAVNTVARTVNTAQALQQGDLKTAVSAQGGTAAKLVRAADTVNKVQTALAPTPSTLEEIDRIRTLANISKRSVLEATL
jgi:hypothetical protein